MITFSPDVSCCLAKFFIPKECFFVTSCNRKQQFGNGRADRSRYKEISSFFYSPADTICLTQSTRQALFPASTRATLKSFGDVFAKSGYQYRCKWDGTLGTASAGFEVIRQPWKHSILKGQRICGHKRKECWFKTQVVWGKFQHKVVLKSLPNSTLPSSDRIDRYWRRFSRKAT